MLRHATATALLFVALAARLSCADVTGEPTVIDGYARDRYGRLLAVCYAGGEDLNGRIVR
jgi:endonuclease YncB( thermonuclease family)